MTTPSASTATASGSAAMLRETYELRAHAVDRLRVLLHEKLAREGLSAQALLDAGATPTPTAATTIAAGNASASSNSVSSTTTTAAASRGDGGRRSFMCWLCAKVTSVIYRVRNTYELCFTCFRMFYISAVLPLLDTPERRRSDVDFLHRIALLQTHTPTSRGAAAASSSSMQHNCSRSTGGGGGNADEWAMTTRTAAAAAHRTARGRGDGDDASILDVSDPSQASFVMNASVMLQRRTAANAHVFSDIASYARNPCAVATSNNNSSGGGGSTTAAASPVVATTTATTAADARVSARAAPASMWSCRQCTYINPETARVCEVCGCAFVDSVTCRVCGKVCSMATLASYAQNGNNHNNNSSSNSGSFAAADDDKADALSAAAGAAGSAVVTRSSRSNSATSGSGSSGGGLGVCKDGRPHLLWSCAQCQGINTLDGDVCALCRQPRYWVCGYCTDRHSAQRVTDGLRYCVTCGSYNTPDDLKKGQSKVDYEVLKQQQQQHEEAAAAARQQRERALSSSSLSAAAAAAAAAAAGATTGGGDATVFGVNDADTLAQLRRQREIADNESRLNERLRALQIARNVRKSDGNCLFAALAHQLFGKASMCHTVRSMIVHYMRMHADDYAVLFTAREWERYISQMRESGFWGDELCLNAAARCFHVDIHVITSDPARWHIVFHHKDLSMSQSYRGRGSAGDRRHNNNKSNSDDRSSGSRGLTMTTATATRTLPAVLGHGDDSQHSQQQQHYQGKRYSSSSSSGNNNNNSSSSTSAVASAALHSTLHQDLPVLRAACGAPDDAAATAERLVRQGRDVVSPRAGEPESVCVFLAYLSPVHYDDIGLSAAPPVRLPELFVKEVRQTLATMLTSSPSVTTTATTTMASSPLVVALSSPLARHKGSISSNNNSGSRSSLTAAMLSAQQPPSQHSSTATTAAVQRRSSAMHLHGGKTPTQPPTLP